MLMANGAGIAARPAWKSPVCNGRNPRLRMPPGIATSKRHCSSRFGPSWKQRRSKNAGRDETRLRTDECTLGALSTKIVCEAVLPEAGRAVLPPAGRRVMPVVAPMGEAKSGPLPRRGPQPLVAALFVETAPGLTRGARTMPRIDDANFWRETALPSARFVL